MSSVVGEMGNVGQTAYAASKAALIGAAKSIAREYASRNITVNVVAPGFIDTDMTSNMTDAMKEQLVKVVPLGRTGTAGRSPRPASSSPATRRRTSPARSSASTAACTSDAHCAKLVRATAQKAPGCGQQKGCVESPPG